MANGLLVLSAWHTARLVYSKTRQGVDSKAEALIVYSEATPELHCDAVVLVLEGKEFYSLCNHLQQ